MVSSSAFEFLDKKNVDLLSDYLALSPDLSIIENM